MSRGRLAMLRVALFLLAATIMNGEASNVKIRSKFGQPLTSSTLHWESVNSDATSASKIPDDAIEAGQRSGESIYICRARHNGQELIGSSDGITCTVILFDSSHDYNKFQVRND